MTTLPTPEEALARARDAGIHLLRIPTPFAVGRVNCYLIEDEPLTLVDTGPNSGKALDELERQIDDLGYAIADLELVIALRSVSRSFRAWGAHADVTRPLHDGEELRFAGRALEVQHRPGHSPSDT